MSRLWELTPTPRMRVGLSGVEFTPQWNCVFLFFNLASGTPADYAPTTVAQARRWLDEGPDPTRGGIADFVFNYWFTMSYGRFGCGVDTPRDAAGAPVIPTIAPPAAGPGSWRDLVAACVRANPEAVWQAAGSLIHPENGHRFIPNVVLVHNYYGAVDARGGFTLDIGGVSYDIGSFTHFWYEGWVEFGRLPSDVVLPARVYWGTLAHEQAHNFLEFGDLYGPNGCTGYWDILGDNSPPTVMSEASSVHKERIGWLTYQRVVTGPRVPAQRLRLQPYTTTGDAIKVVPDPEHNPSEYFVLEYRRSTGSEVWRPDGALPEAGLMITHMDTRLGGPSGWAKWDAPYFDPEFADFTDRGGAWWTGWDRLRGILFRTGASFTPETSPSSAFYGPWPNGLSITDIVVSDEAVDFTLSISHRPAVGWVAGAADRSLAGRFSDESRTLGSEIFIHNERDAAILEHRQAHWFVRARFDAEIDGWSVAGTDRWLAADIDRDGRSELVARRAGRLAAFSWAGDTLFRLVDVRDTLGDWPLVRADGRELAADLDGDGRDELILRADTRIGVARFTGRDEGLQLLSHQRRSVGAFVLDTASQQEWAGRFTGPDSKQLVVRSGNSLTLLVWDESTRQLRASPTQSGAIGRWPLQLDDRLTIADVDGDGMDEIYIRSAARAGVLKWNGTAFDSIWVASGALAARVMGESPATIPLDGDDRSYAGRFTLARDGILHRANNRLCILTWEGDAMKVRRTLGFPTGGWTLSPADELVVADFHAIGPEFAQPGDGLGWITDNIADVFLHNGWGAAMIAFNRPWLGDGSAPGARDEFFLTWINAREIMLRRPALLITPIPRRPFTWYIIGNLADGPYIIFGPEGPRPIGPWDPTVVSQLAMRVQPIRDQVAKQLAQLPSPKD